MPKDLPLDMPEEVKVVRDRVISAVYSGQEVEDNDLKRLEDYFHYENYDYLEHGCFGFNFEYFMSCLYFHEVASVMEVEEEKLTDDIILSYLRDELSKHPGGGVYENTSMLATLSDKEGMSVCMGFLMNLDEDPENDLGALGVYKTQKDFEDSLDVGEWFIQGFDVNELTDTDLLAAWNKHSWTATKEQASLTSKGKDF